MRSTRIFVLAALIVLSAGVTQAHPYELAVGGAAYLERMPYKDESYDFTPFPLVQFESEYFYFDTTTAGIYVHKTENTSLTLIGTYYSTAFNPSKSDNPMMKHLDRRNSTVMAGVNLTAWGPYGIVRAQILNDVLFMSEGARSKLSYLLYFKPKGVHVLPEAGVYWYSGMHNRYYYGVTEKESAKTGFERYKPDGGFIPYLGISAMYEFQDLIRLTAKADYFLLPSEVKNSPITDKTTTASFFLGLTYIFK